MVKTENDPRFGGVRTFKDVKYGVTVAYVWSSFLVAKSEEAPVGGRHGMLPAGSWIGVVLLWMGVLLHVPYLPHFLPPCIPHFPSLPE